MTIENGSERWEERESVAAALCCFSTAVTAALRCQLRADRTHTPVTYRANTGRSAGRRRRRANKRKTSVA